VKQLLLGDLPKAGEPLKHAIDDDNKVLLETDIQERINRQQSRLTKKELKALFKRKGQLHKQLNELNYNKKIIRQDEYIRLKEQLIYLFKTQPDQPPRMIAKFDRVKKRCALIELAMNDIKPVIDEYEDVSNQITAHEELIKWEVEDTENFEAFKREARTWEAQLQSAFKQSPRLHHTGFDAKGKRFIIIPKIEKIIIKDDRVLFLVKTTSQNAIEKFFGKWHSALPYGVDVSSLISEETLENLSIACNRIVTVERSKRGTNLFYVISRLDAPDGIPNKVNYQQVVDWYPIKEHKKAPFPFGVGEDRKVIHYNLEDTPHVLIAGASNGGKSNLVNAMIATLVTMNTPDEIRIMLVDLKGGIEFTHWRNLQHQVRPMATTPTTVLEGLQWLRLTMEKRLIALEKLKAKNFLDYNVKAKKKLPRLICFIDELATIVGLNDLTKALHGEMRVLSAQGRAVGVHLVLCTQHPSVEVIPSVIKTNMMLRISALMPSYVASMLIMDSAIASNLPDVIGRMCSAFGAREKTAQTPLISDAQIAQAIKTANAYPAPDESQFEEDKLIIVAKPAFGEEDALNVALHQLDGVLAVSRINEIIGTKLISLRNLRILVKGLIARIKEDGGIRVDGKFYDIKKVGSAHHLIEAEEPEAKPEPIPLPVEQPIEQEPPLKTG